ncbi:hypothetical protein EJ04DRAFT_46936 [Polyplosphaeria fusca]|uniref:Uncharacterized protein n=1 Tax=Polyplosphaeria fusca TaxID=682080 RepID=A0A9P4UYS3_9PLEO|nr:hypothetical protein EJ04DRAFT_46936 [Polyplosphaeria fusca]
MLSSKQDLLERLSRDSRNATDRGCSLGLYNFSHGFAVVLFVPSFRTDCPDLFLPTSDLACARGSSVPGPRYHSSDLHTAADSFANPSSCSGACSATSSSVVQRRHRVRRKAMRSATLSRLPQSFTRMRLRKSSQNGDAEKYTSLPATLS